MWLGTGSGLALYDRNRLVTRVPLPLADASASVLLADRAGNVWVGNTAGVARLNVGTSTWSSFTTAQGLPDNAVKDLAQAGDGNVYASTAGGLAYFVEASSSFVAQAQPDGATALPLAVDELGRLWAGNGMLSGSTWKMRYYTNSGLKQAALNDVAADGADRVYFAQNGGVVMRGTFLPPLAEEVPVITDYNPKRGALNTEITIDGSGFGTDPSGVQVQIGGRDVAVTEVTNNRIRVWVNGQVQTGLLSVRRGKRRTTAGTGFCATPTLLSTTPTGGNVGVAVNVRGYNFDPNASITLGAAPHKPAASTVNFLSTNIEAGDRNGNLIITNACAGETATQADFRKFDLSIERLILNQNYPSFGLHAGNATLVSAYLRVNGTPRPSDVIGVDRVDFRISTPANTEDVTVPLVGGRPPFFAAGVPINTNTTAGALNIPNIKFSAFGTGTVRVALSVNARSITQQSTPVTVNVGANNTYILLVPIMQPGYTGAQLNTFKTQMSANLADFQSRIYPGGLKAIWADEALSSNQIVASGLISIPNVSEFNNAAPQIEVLRKRFNEARNASIVGTAIGVINPLALAPNSNGGMGSLGNFNGWKTQQECIDDADDLIDEIGDFLGLGDDDCGPEQPRYMAWVGGNNNLSFLMGHELGHNMGMVQKNAPHYVNYGGPGGNFHDGASELVSGNPPVTVQCGTPFQVYSFSRTFNQQPNVGTAGGRSHYRQ